MYHSLTVTACWCYFLVTTSYLLCCKVLTEEIKGDAIEDDRGVLVLGVHVGDEFLEFILLLFHSSFLIDGSESLQL